MIALMTAPPPGGHTTPEPIPCAQCGAPAVARITLEFLCADHALEELAARADAR